ncbi:hypothetical protein [Aurantiacibacter gangjinensis]|uniref:Uncharacterized protein n=1 Tax=Aurantiacibacter gangjinensis TaxID=502682 RepID=A0A0G9ML61_9SPHN|nr:hypothetical protein [Aurantiacibacter gangjinensis]APE27322.1 hypothetical protein BMF35_a0493 [Aurantiacibacter gangjinensis]KLE31422.1 hypothetical protein AAW01_07450 [Aurantiacibacter gangjinensis]
MQTANLSEKLKDPAYLDRHLVAATIVRQLSALDWYDSLFLRHWVAARRYLAIVRPDRLAQFEDGFLALKPAAGFEPIILRDMLGEARRSELAQIVSAMPPSLLETHELSSFGRYVVHDHPPFSALQQELLPLVSDHAGMALEAGYNFLSLYGAEGRCPPHMDQPISMFTLDYCIDQDGEWPIHFSQMVEWPELGKDQALAIHEIASDERLQFQSVTLQPDDAVFFCGSSQWHYRDPKPASGHCHLLFFHYFPEGCADLVTPSSWPRHFDLPELEPLLDLLAETGAASD